MNTLLTIPLEPNIADQQFDIDLENKIFNFRITWNSFGEYWYLSLRYLGGSATIINNIKLIANVSLIKRYQLNVFDGDLILIDQKKRLSRPTLTSLGQDHLLVYLPPHS